MGSEQPKLLAVGIDMAENTKWLPELEQTLPKPKSYTKADTIAAWYDEKRCKRTRQASQCAWIGRVDRVIFADPYTGNVLFDTTSVAAVPASMAAYDWLIQDGMRIDPSYGLQSHVLFGWRLREAIRGWGAELVARAPKAERLPPPLRFWHKPKQVYSILPIVLNTTERIWVPEYMWAEKMFGTRYNPYESNAAEQLESLLTIAKRLDLSAALLSGKMDELDDFETDGDYH